MNLSPGAQMALTIITSVLASGGLWATIEAFISKRMQNKSALSIAVQCLLRNEIMKAEEKYRCQGWCDPDDKTNVEKMYHAYKTLGGNDVAHKAYLSIMDLPNAKPQTKMNK